MSSRTGLRLQLMREQSMNESPGSPGSAERQSSNPVAVRASTASGTTSGCSSSVSSRASPIIISHPIKFTGNRLVHLPPQIIHVQRQGENGAPSRVVLSTSVNSQPANVTPPKVMTVIRQERNVTPQQQASRTSPADLSPQNADSPYSASAGNSEIDDIIIDGILSLEDEQLRRAQLTSEQLASSYSSGRPLSVTPSPSPLSRQVSNSAPTSSNHIEGLVKQELKELDRDRRKKDIHNMIERRRRYNINDRIKELGTILPKSFSEDMKLNKGSILKASVDYIRLLQRDRDHMLKMQQHQQSADCQAQNYLARIRELEETMVAHGVPVPDPSPVSSLGRSPISSYTPNIKQEPIDEMNISPTQSKAFVTPAPPHQGAVSFSPVFDLTDTTAAICLDPQADVLETPPVLPVNIRGPFEGRSAPVGGYGELMMDLGGGPLLGNDPMISAGQSQAASQLSPDVNWDASAFSPDAQTGAQQMDLS